jgi:alkaline phosphatase D
MRFTRRRVLVGGASFGALSLVGGCDDGGKADDTGPPLDEAATPVRGAEPAPWDAHGTEDADTFAWGVQVGDATPSTAIVSVRTPEPTVTIVLAVADGEGWAEVDRLEGLATDVEVAQVLFEGLLADTAYSVAVYTADGTRRSRVGRFRTALAPDGWRVVTFGATSCLGGNEPWPSLSFAAAERLDFFCLVGDTIYADYAPDELDYEMKWSTALSTEGLRAVTGSTSIIASWDDHEVANNWSFETGGLEDLFVSGLTAFRRGLPQTIGPGGTGLWRKLSWGAVVDVITLDCRGERRDGRYMSVAQMDWLKATLSASTARFKIVLNSVPITDLSAVFGSAQEQDRWSGFPDERSEILGHIRDNGIPGVVWLTGDVHYAQVGHVDPAGGLAADQWEVLVGPGGSRLNAIVGAFVGSEQYPVMFAQWNWARFTCDPGAGTVTVAYVGDDGAEITGMVLEV